MLARRALANVGALAEQSRTLAARNGDLFAAFGRWTALTADARRTRRHC